MTTIAVMAVFEVLMCGIVGWIVFEVQKLIKQRSEDAEFKNGQCQAIETLQKQVAKLATNQLVTQKTIDEVMAFQKWQKEVEGQIDVLKAEIDAKATPNPSRRPHRWSEFRAQVQGQVNA